MMNFCPMIHIVCVREPVRFGRFHCSAALICLVSFCGARTHMHILKSQLKIYRSTFTAVIDLLNVYGIDMLVNMHNRVPDTQNASQRRGSSEKKNTNDISSPIHTHISMYIVHVQRWAYSYTVRNDYRTMTPQRH